MFDGNFNFDTKWDNEKSDKEIFGVNSKGFLTNDSAEKDFVIWRNMGKKSKNNNWEIAKNNSNRNSKEAMKISLKLELKEYIKPINAEIIQNYIPKKGENVFFLMNGNCQFVDFISEFIKCLKSPVEEIWLTTLSLNRHTFDTLDKILPKITKNILVSSYFLATDSDQILFKLKEENRLKNYQIGFFRNHTKMVLIKSGENCFLFTGSANLRSSGTIEQFSIYNNEKLYNFNQNWISELIAKYNFENESSIFENTGQASFNFLENFEF